MPTRLTGPRAQPPAKPSPAEWREKDPRFVFILLFWFGIEFWSILTLTGGLSPTSKMKNHERPGGL